mmetsp:Transcript_34700/g.81310  ORF Transcript_34700/g.81310 Transcript_34700/m.81310 type:complete len:120 (-) Transcript_34700:249-608(-)
MSAVARALRRCFRRCLPLRPALSQHHCRPIKPEKDSLLSMYGLDELSDAEEDEDLATKPMSPEQVQALLERQIALTRELDDVDVRTPPQLTSSASASASPPLRAPSPAALSQPPPRLSS